MELEKLPVPDPSTVLLFDVVGFDEMLQLTPRAVTVAPPSDDTLPPLDAVVVPVADVELVDTVGTVTLEDVVNVTSLP